MINSSFYVYSLSLSFFLFLPSSVVRAETEDEVKTVSGKREKRDIEKKNGNGII